jgi:hypothetical protein
MKNADQPDACIAPARRNSQRLKRLVGRRADRSAASA